MLYEVLLFVELVWNIPLLLCMISVFVIYAYFLRRFTNMKFYHKQPLLFLLSLGLLYISVGSPLSGFSHLSFSLHMLQMSILYFIIPPLILLGIPNEMFKQMVKTPLIKRINRLFIKPKPALFVFAFLFFIYHLPVTLNLFFQNLHIQNGFLLLLFILSFSMWWPIVSPVPKQRLPKKQRKRYAIRSGAILMPACILFILNGLVAGIDNPLLTHMTAQLCMPAHPDSLSLLPPPFNTRFDHILAGTLMLGLHKLGIVLSFHLGKIIL